MSTGDVDTAAAARLMEALMTDARLRERFRRDPVAACRDAGLHGLADEMAAGSGKAMQTLDLRESRSSLAGVLMAAAVEGFAVWQVVEHAGDVGDAVADMLSQVQLPAIPDPRGGSAGGPAVVAAALPDEEAAAAGGAAGLGGVAEPSGEAGGSEAAAPGSTTDAGADPAADADTGAGAADTTRADAAAATRAAATSAPATTPATTDASATAPDEEPARPVDAAADAPAATTPASLPDDATPGDAGVAAVPPAVDRLLADDRLTADEALERALRDGDLGDAAPAALQAAVDEQPITARLSPDGRSIDITQVAGVAVDDANVAARDLAETLGALPADARPHSIGTPWSIGGARFTTGPEVGDRLRLELLDVPEEPAANPGADGSTSAAATPGGPDASSAPADGAAAGEPVVAAAAPAPSVNAAPPAPGAAPAAAPAAAAPTPTPAPVTPTVDSSEPARAGRPGIGAASRNDTLTLVVPRAERAAGAPDRNASLTLPAIDPKGEQATAEPAAAAAPDAGGVGPLSPTDYPGDGATKAQFAAWMGAAAQKRGLPPELPVMASLVESGMKNLNYGDRDSVGFFQMRTGIWDQGEYAGYGEKPELQIKWFLDHAEAVRKDRVASGRSVDDPQQFGEWIADVERPAAQYRGRYQLQLDAAQALLRDAAGTATAPPASAAAVPVAAPTAAEPAPAAEAIHDPGNVAHDHPAGSSDAPSSPEALAKAAGRAALANDRLHFDDVGVADLKAGKIDPRILAVLTDLSKEHEISVSCMRSDHGKFTAGGSISNHFHGRGVDIATVDGQRVEPGSTAARELAEKIVDLSDDHRPDEVGTPWALSAPGHFTDAGHQDHIHIAFKTELSESWKPPSSLLGEPARAAVPAGAAPGAAAVTGAVGEAARSDTLSLPAMAERQSGQSGEPSRNASLSLPAIRSDDVRAQPAAAAGADASVAPAAAAAGAAPAAADPVAVEPADPAAAAGAVQPAAAVADAASAVSPRSAAGPRALAAVAAAQEHLGTPYRWGGSSPATGFDCSGLVQWAYAQQGIAIPRVTYDQIEAKNGVEVARGALQPGDLVFFATAAGDVHHVGMSLGGDRFIHAPHTGDVVKVSSLKEPYYDGQFAGGRRFDGSVTASATPAAAVAPATAATPAEANDQAASTPAAAAPAGEPVAQRAGLVSGAPSAGDVAEAEAARVRDAQAARDPSSMIFQALSEQEAVGHRSTMQFLAAVEPQQAERLATAAAEAGIDAAPLPQGAVGYPGDDASQEEMARWLASQARKHGLPPELPVMASLVESGLKNLNYGDRDSVGFFQMRTGIWDQGEYAGYGEKPELQAKWFVDHALAVKRARLAAGDEDFGRDPSSWGEWIADVERPAEQYRGRYQLRLAEARRLLGR